MPYRCTRRSLVLSAATLATFRPRVASQASSASWSFPIARPGDIPGNGFRIGHGFATQNTWFYPDGWHAGEDWYAIDGDTAGMEVLAVADGEIVYAGYDYPGLVVIVEHDEELYSVYGHLDDDLPADAGPVTRGDRLGTVHDRSDGRAPSHLHFEVRRFLTSPDVNGTSPRYAFTCGPNCPPGPGYWPINAPEHPVAMGWRNPTHEILRRAMPGIDEGRTAEVVVAEGAGRVVPRFATPGAPQPAGDVSLEAGTRYTVDAMQVGAANAEGTSAEAYQVWFRIRLPESAEESWVRAVEPSDAETGADGRPSTVRLILVPVPNS